MAAKAHVAAVSLPADDPDRVAVDCTARPPGVVLLFPLDGQVLERGPARPVFAVCSAVKKRSLPVARTAPVCFDPQHGRSRGYSPGTGLKAL